MRKEPDVMKKTNHLGIQAKLFDFALSELVRGQRNSFAPIWTIDSWVKFLIWLSLNCGLSGDRESLESFAIALGSSLTIRMRKIFFERVLDDFSLHVMADPADPQVLVMPIGADFSLTNENVQQALDVLGLTHRVNNDLSEWESHDRLISIPWNSSESYS